MPILTCSSKKEDAGAATGGTVNWSGMEGLGEGGVVSCFKQTGNFRGSAADLAGGMVAHHRMNNNGARVDCGGTRCDGFEH